MRLPDKLVEHIYAVTVERRSPAYLVTDQQGTLLYSGGSLDLYGLKDLRAGDEITSIAYFLEGILPLDSKKLTLFDVEMVSGAFADVHLLSDGAQDWILMLDASSRVDEQRRIQEALRRSEEHLHQSERMETMGRLAGGISHDFNNLLTVIAGYSEMLMLDFQHDEKVRAPAQEIKSAADRAAMLTGQLLAFSRRQVINPKHLKLNEVIEGVLSMLRRLIREGVQFNIKLMSELPCIKTDHSQLEQVIVNLALNARDAMPNGGELTIETGMVDALDKKVNSGEVFSTPSVFLAVSDTGTGMDQNTLTHIFEPFFTTKAPGKGTGLGLATVYGIVRQAGGIINVKSSPGHGSRFEIYFPKTEGTTEVGKVSSVASIPPLESKTVLLVDDDKVVRRLIADTLQRRGYKILEASGGQEALLIAENYLAKLDLVLSDIVMPEMSGVQLGLELQKRRPDLKVILMSGYANERGVHQDSPSIAAAVLQKPFSFELLNSVIQDVLESGQNGIDSLQENPGKN